MSEEVILSDTKIELTPEVESGEVILSGAPIELTPDQKAMMLFQSYYDAHVNDFGEYSFVCKYCPSYKTDNEKTMRDHVNQKHLKVKLKCTHCKYEAYRAKDLQTHRRYVHNINPLECCVEFCPFKTVLAEKLQDHLETIHQVEKSNAAEATQQIIANQQPSGPPRKAPGGKPPPGLNCANKTLQSKGKAKHFFLASSRPQRRMPKVKNHKADDMKLYKVTEIGDQTVYECTFCKGHTMTEQEIKSHISTSHKDFCLKCPECDFTAFHQKAINIHVKKKHGQTKRKCIVPDCKFECFSNDNLEVHLLSKHGSLYDEKKHAIVVQS